MFATQSLLKTNFLRVRQRSETICKPLAAEDHVVQPVSDVSPPKWHLAHTTWFFETFLLQEFKSDYQLFDKDYAFLFNSYYVAKGDRMIRANRGNMTRPTTSQIWDYRHHVDKAMSEWLEEELSREQEELVVLGLNHEEQHQELLMYDIKYILGTNPLFPAYKPSKPTDKTAPELLEWLTIDEGTYQIGHMGNGFCFDNELGSHKIFLHAAALGDRLITNREYRDFIKDKGYSTHYHWHSEGWEWVNNNGIKAPLYWHEKDNRWYEYNLNGGLQILDPNAPVCHINYFEASAYAKWAGCRLPTEFEWEVACHSYGSKDKGNFMESGSNAPLPIQDNHNQFYGDLWEWTGSAYLAYPYYAPPEGAVGEYNGKFMVNQMVLRGGSCATPKDHIRSTYRNFFHPHLRWMFSGLRLAKYL